jgi:CDP-paratose 2-epimerase
MNGASGDQARRFGIAEWFRLGDYDRVDRALDHLDALGAKALRTHLSWADYHADGGAEWYDWLIPRLAGRVELLPCIHYTPPSLSMTGSTAGPPRRARDLADFVDHALDRYGAHFAHIELWNEPNNLLDWDWRVDTEWTVFADMAGAAAHWAEKRGHRVVLGGPCPFDLNWLHLMGERGLLGEVSAISIHGFPGTWDSEASTWGGWDGHIAAARALVEQYRPGMEIWITEAGYSTWRHDEVEQARRFLDALDAPADRLFWYGLYDLHPDTPIQEGRQFDIRHYFMGVRDVRGREKLLARLLREGGPAAVRRKVSLTRARAARTKDPVLITGGAGFIGSNLADALLADGREVIVFDNFSRAGVSANLDWLSERHGARVLAQAADIRDRDALADAVTDAACVYHLAAQVAVTDSLAYPVEDFEVNARGTLNILEAIRAKGRGTPLVFASTNKVYGPLEAVETELTPAGHLPCDPDLRRWGIGEDVPLDLSTPYGCSKGAADQYVVDYAHSFGIPTAVLRMSCIYGPRQFGTEDQGWVAHFMIRALEGAPVTVFGDGAQVRDVLHVADAVRAYRIVMADIARLAGQAFNLGGGPGNAVSLGTMLAAIERLTGRSIERLHEAVRTGDQPYFVADTRRLSRATGWQAQVPWEEGVRDLLAWLRATRFPQARCGGPTLVHDNTKQGESHARRAGQSALGV